MDTQAIVAQLHEKYDKNNFSVAQSILDYIPFESAKIYGIVPFELDKEGRLIVGALNTDSLEARDALNFISSKENIEYILVPIDQVLYDQVISQYNSSGEYLEEALQAYEQERMSNEQDITTQNELDTTEVIKEDAPVIKIVDTIFIRALDARASDIHIDPGDNKTEVRIRIDGTLETAFSFPKKLHPPLVAQIKIRSRIRIDENRIPQDGRFSATVTGRRIDFRVATFPTHGGEKIVLRLLDSSDNVKTFKDLGFGKDHQELIKAGLQRPYGLILVSGPTGSGKTTTVRTIMSQLDRKRKNAVSLEDPVEYSIDNVSQSEIRPEIGYTFASGLRSILRGDPDIIFVGEIRDVETARLAVQAALTGHIVISTIHTNSAAGVIARLIDMGIEPFLIAPTVSLIVSQRLVHQIAEGAGKEITLTSEYKQEIAKTIKELPSEIGAPYLAIDKAYVPQAIAGNPKGTRGRLAVSEVMVIDQDMQDLIFSTPLENEIYALARKKGMISMKEDALLKTSKGLIPFSEVGATQLSHIEETEEEATPSQPQQKQSLNTPLKKRSSQE